MWVQQNLTGNKASQYARKSLPQNLEDTAQVQNASFVFNDRSAPITTTPQITLTSSSLLNHFTKESSPHQSNTSTLISFLENKSSFNTPGNLTVKQDENIQMEDKPELVAL
jgi:hypothetical protein